MTVTRILVVSAFMGLAIFSCKKGDPAPPVNNNNNTGDTTKLDGGKGGAYSVAFFSRYQGKGKASRIYMKYAADKRPADTASGYDEKFNTMTEPGFGPHAHFEHLTKGTYYVYLAAGTLTADTVLRITESSRTSQDIYVELE